MRDGLLLVGFGAPETPEDVWPFLTRIAERRHIPIERLQHVAHHYEAIGGSPLNAQNRSLLEAIAVRLRDRGIDVPVALGHRNVEPSVAEALGELTAAGCTDVLAFFATPWSSYSSCRQYREDVAMAQPDIPVACLTPFHDLPEIVEANVRAIEAVEGIDEDTHVLFSTHSLPVTDAEASGPTGGAYEAQQLAIAEEVARRCGIAHWELVFQCRSGGPQTPWLEPDVNDAIRALPAEVGHVVVVPIGFLTDHVEVLWDLDHEAAETASERGLRFNRARTIGTDPVFLDGLARRVGDVLGGDGLAAVPPSCSGTCCPGRMVRPAAPVVGECR